MRPGEINVDPIEGEFFSTEAIGSVTDALVRESIQNSLDAGDGRGPVTVCFSFHSGLGGTADPDKRHYLAGLDPHLQSRHSGLPDRPSPQEPVDYLLIEDYGTHGLQGDIAQYDDLDDDRKRNDFYYFWRNIGRTRKESTDRGRWGLGKTVFQAASRVNSFFGMTARKDDGRLLLMGQSVLKIHKIGQARYAPYGYFGVFEGELALPVEDESCLVEFCRLFQVNRFGKPGLSVMLPYPDKEIKAVDCIRSVVKHYFYPILSGQLIVKISEFEKTYTLDALNLDALLKKPRFKQGLGLLGCLDLARWAIKRTEDTLIPLKPPEAGRAPKLREDLFEPEMLERIKQHFAEGRRLAFQVPVSIQRINSKEFRHTAFSVFIERDDALERAEDHFIRQGITIPEVTSLKHKGIRAIVSITDPVLSTFLGDAENPAHTDWERNNKRFKQRYRLGVSTLDFVKSCPRELVKILTQPKKGRDENLLRHIFSLSFAAAEQTGGKGQAAAGEGESESTPSEPAVGVLGFKPLQLSAIKGGFSLTRKAGAEAIPKTVSIQMAYEVRSGNPFKKYTPLDFDVAAPPIQIALDGARILLNKHNVIHFEVQKVNFRVSVTGFDMHRDLRIKTFP
jgi:hypothetical protein